MAGNSRFQLPQVVARLQDVLWWLEDIEVLRYRQCSPLCAQSVSDLATGKLKIAHIFNVSRHLSQDAAMQVVAERLYWPVIHSMQSAEMDRCNELCKKIGARAFNEIAEQQGAVPTAVARMSVAVARHAAALRIGQPLTEAFLPALRIVDLDAETLNVVLDAVNMHLQELVVTFLKEAPNLQDLRLPFWSADAPKLEPVPLCRVLGLLTTNGTGSGIGSLLSAPFLTKLQSADLLNSLQLPKTTEDARWTGFLCRCLVSAECISVLRRESEGPFEIAEDICSRDIVHTFISGFYEADCMQGMSSCSATRIGFSGTDLRGPSDKLAQFVMAFPNLTEICIGGSVTCGFDLMGCLLDEDTLSGLANFAPERLAQLQTFSVLFSDGLRENAGLLSLLRAASPSLQKLDFSGCDFGSGEAKLLANGGCEMSALRIWRLSKCPISSQVAAKSLGQAVARFAHIEELDVEMCIGWNSAVRASFVAGLGSYPAERLKKIIIGNPYHDTWPNFKGTLATLRRKLQSEGYQMTATGRVLKRPSIALKRPASVLKRPANKA